MRININSRAAIVALLLTTTLAAQANLLNNGNFNTGDLTGWWSGGADASQTTTIDNAYTLDATPNAAMASASSAWRGYLGQNPVLAPNTTYAVSFDYSATGTPTWGSAALSITFKDISWNYADGFVWAALYDQSPSPNADGQWMHYSSTFTTTANTANSEFVFDAWNWTTFHVDNVELNVVPEPTVLALLGVAGVMFLGSRRRN